MRRTYRARQEEIKAALPRHMSASTAADMLGCTSETIIARIQRGVLDGYQTEPGGPWLLPVGAFQDYLRRIQGKNR